MNASSRSFIGRVWPIVVLAVSGCAEEDNLLVPNRVLDRPLDTVLACVRDTGSAIEVLSLNQCKGDTQLGDCNRVGVDGSANQLIGFVTNSERNEVAMFRRCDNEASVVDMDPKTPGYNFVPTGHLPSDLEITDDSCRVISANVGSCDLTLLDVAGMASYAIGRQGNSTDDDRVPAVSLTATLIPRKSNGVPLGSAPGQILSVPASLSLAGNTVISDPSDGAGETGSLEGDDGGVIDTETGDVTGGIDPPVALTCDPRRPASIYVTFPSCQLVAEVSLTSQAILQSRQFVTNEDGEIELIDAGTEPRCPVDCPSQFQSLPEELDFIDPNGVFPSTIELVTPRSSGTDLSTADEQIVSSSLFVGGPGSDTLWEIEIGDDGRFIDAPASSLTLENARGIQRLRVTPPFEIDESGSVQTHQFIYAVAGDGSTHVVDRDFDPGMLGIECDTQVDPTLAPLILCTPNTASEIERAFNRRPFANGPGIRAPGGATINDWAFHRADEMDIENGDNDNCPTADSTSDSDPARVPFCRPGAVVGVGVTSIGTVVYSNFGQFLNTQTLAAGVDPLGLMRVQVPPHSLWPAVDPFVDDPALESLPLVADDAVAQFLPRGGTETQPLSPSMRRIDMTYAVDDNDDPNDQQSLIAAALGNPTNVDGLGNPDGAGLYTANVARVVVRDYQQWGAQRWVLEWEPTVPNTSSSTGLLRCDETDGTDDGNGTCNHREADDSRLIDQGAAFCEEGVLAGDKLVILGCVTDDNCGFGQVCLREPIAPSTVTGICVPEASAGPELRAQCAPYISNPCGNPQREYRITKATNQELQLAPLERAPRSVVRDMAVEGESGADLREYSAKFSCETPVEFDVESECTSDNDCLFDPYQPSNQRVDLVCAEEDSEGSPRRCIGQQPDGGCTEDNDCAGLGAQYLCIDDYCRAPCNLCPPPTQPDTPCRTDSGCEAEEVCIAGLCHQPCAESLRRSCLLSPLPDSGCFPELVNYTVRLHESLGFYGSSAPLFAQRVVEYSGTETPDRQGECVVDPGVSNLLNSRIRLGPTEDATFGTGPWQIPDCISSTPSPDDPNPCRIVTPRQTAADTQFHTFAYFDEPVSAIRYSNPVLSVVIDLVSLTGLTSDPPEFTGQDWPVRFANFLRARIQPGYREEFTTVSGYRPINEGVVIGSVPLIYPVSIIPGPEANSDFIVDAGGRGDVGIRGQVVRITHSNGQVTADTELLVR